MNKWNDYFKIVQTETEQSRENSATSWMLDEYYHYELHDPDGKVVGTYKDLKYARKQAKYKFKKLMTKLENILLV